MGKRLSLFPDEMVVDAEKQKAKSDKRNWENAFQKWSDDRSQDETTPEGICGYGIICDFCEDNTFGRPCVRALNEMCREKRLSIDYTKRDFAGIWYGEEGSYRKH